MLALLGALQSLSHRLVIGCACWDPCISGQYRCYIAVYLVADNYRVVVELCLDVM